MKIGHEQEKGYLMREVLEEMRGTLLKIQGVERWDSESPWDRDSKDALVATAKVISHYIDQMIASGHIQHMTLRDCIQTLKTISGLTCIPNAETLIRDLDSARGKLIGSVAL